MPELFFAHGTIGVDLVTQHEERHLGEFLDGQESVQLGLAFRETLRVGAVDEKDDSVDFWEVIPPQTTGWRRKPKKKKVVVQ